MRTTEIDPFLRHKVIHSWTSGDMRPHFSVKYRKCETAVLKRFLEAIHADIDFRSVGLKAGKTANSIDKFDSIDLSYNSRPDYIECTQNSSECNSRFLF